MLLGSGDAILSEMGVQNFQQGLHGWLAVHLYVRMDLKILKYIINLFHDRHIVIPLLKMCDIFRWYYIISPFSVQQYYSNDNFKKISFFQY